MQAGGGRIDADADAGDRASLQDEGKFPTLKEAEWLHVKEALQRAGGNQGTAAALLGISRPALNRRLAKRKDD